MPERKCYRKTYQIIKKKKGVLFAFKVLFFCPLFFIFCSLFLFIYYAKDLPRPEVFTERQLTQSTKIFDRTGQVLLYEIYGEEKRTWVSLERIPPSLKQAVIAAEDADFYSHFGIDFKGIVRAILADLEIGKLAQGGSTIPQQLIRSTFLSTEKTVGRKIREIILAIELDRRHSKEQILEWYLNQVPFGQNAYGVEAASRVYFQKGIEEISLPEAAVLASLIRAPYRLSPYEEEGKKELLIRKDYVLDRMVRLDYLKKEETELAKKEEIKFEERKIEIKAPYFTLWVKQLLEEKYGEEFLRRKGLRVFTSLDWEIQKTAEEVVKKGIERNKNYNAHNAALVAIDPKTGQVLAMTVGSGDYNALPYPKDCTPGVNCLFDPKFNIVVGTKQNPGRQPGSAFKPIIYAGAFEKGYNDEVVVTDSPTNFGLWGGKEYLPQNYDNFFRGEVTLREALAQSLNVPSIKVLYLVGAEEKIEKLTINNFRGLEKIITEGLKKSLELAKKMDISTLDKPLSFYGPSLVLGGGEVKLLELTSAYGVFATEGQKIPSVAILKVEDGQGNIIEENKKTAKRILDEEICRIINSILSDEEARVPAFGRQSPLYFEGYQVAVKTGTTQDYRDAWTIGYTPSLSVGLWAGNNDNSPILKKPGAMIAAPMFHDFLEKVLPKFPKENFNPPTNYE